MNTFYREFENKEMKNMNFIHLLQLKCKLIRDTWIIQESNGLLGFIGGENTNYVDLDHGDDDPNFTC